LCCIMAKSIWNIARRRVSFFRALDGKRAKPI
jgi:hypothetical protein